MFHKDGKEHILGVFNFRLTKEMNPGNVAGKKRNRAGRCQRV